jgi:hypothetical protein
MNRLLTYDLWPVAAKLSRKAETHLAAIAYVTAETVKFGEGDVLVVDATRKAITSGETTAQVLLDAHDAGAQIYNCPNLHAKLLVMDDTAIIGSGNLSGNSPNLHECAVLTDQSSVVGQARAYIQQLRERSRLLIRRELVALTKLPVVRRGGRGQGKAKTILTKTLGTRRWLVGVTPIDKERMSAADKATNDRALVKLSAKLEKDRDDLSWVKLTGSSKMRKDSKVGDLMIVAERSNKKTNHLTVFPPSPVLARKNSENSTFLYYLRGTKRPDIGKLKLAELLREAGSNLVPSHRMVRELTPEVFQALERHWPKR